MYLLKSNQRLNKCFSISPLFSLEKREIVDRLLSYLVDPQPDAGVADPFGNHDDFGGSDFDMERSEDMKRRQRFPFAACEVFCCEIDAIFNTLLENDDLMAKLFGRVETVPLTIKKNKLVNLEETFPRNLSNFLKPKNLHRLPRLSLPMCSFIARSGCCTTRRPYLRSLRDISPGSLPQCWCGGRPICWTASWRTRACGRVC